MPATGRFEPVHRYPEPRVVTARSPSRAVMGSVLVLLLSHAGRATAEMMWDVYGGVSMSETATVRMDQSDPTSGSATKQARFKSTPVLGLRGGYWFTGLFGATGDLGVTGDLGLFRRESNNDDVKVYSLSPQTWIRWRPGASDTSRGRVHVALGFGPSLVHARGTVGPAGSVTRAVSAKTEELGAEARLGLGWTLSEKVSAWLEYRITNVTLHLDETGVGDPYGTGCGFSSCGDVISRSAEVPLNTRHLAIGIRF